MALPFCIRSSALTTLRSCSQIRSSAAAPAGSGSAPGAPVRRTDGFFTQRKGQFLLGAGNADIGRRRSSSILSSSMLLWCGKNPLPYRPCRHKETPALSTRAESQLYLIQLFLALAALHHVAQIKRVTTWVSVIGSSSSLPSSSPSSS